MLARKEIVDAFVLVYKGKRLNQTFNESSIEASINRIVGDRYYMHCNDGEVSKLCGALEAGKLIEEVPIDRWLIDRSKSYKVNAKISKDFAKTLY